MTEWEKLKVTELREELKSRGVPLAGLKLKQQLIDKLVELDAQQGSEDDEKSKIHEEDEAEGAAPPTEAEVREERKDEAVDQTGPDNIEEGDTLVTDSGPMGKEEHNPIFPPLPVTPKVEESKATNMESTAPAPAHPITTAKKRDDPFIPQEHSRNKTAPRPPSPVDSEIINKVEVAERNQDARESSNNPDDEADNQQIDLSQTNEDTQALTASSTRIPTPELLDDQRKRKRRSASPPVESQDIAVKRAKGLDGESIVSKAEIEALEAMREATKEAQEARESNTDGLPMVPIGASHKPGESKAVRAVDGLPDTPELQVVSLQEVESGLTQHSPEPEGNMEPSTHPATSSLYIRNFKRPLHIPTLRSHIGTLARPSAAPKDHDPVKVFYLDNIRTHAFISFTNISEASRVRNNMHGTRFPDENLREKLWVDFVPDDKVQAWIDQESGGSSGFGGGRSGKKWEVVYTKTADGVDVTLQEASDLRMRPAPQPQHSSRSSRHPIGSTSTTAAGIHPDRAHLIPSGPRSHRVSHQPPTRQDFGTGFKALDDLFESTAAKPKLYYKVADRSVATERLSRIEGLHVGHQDMGRSGDEGMKRYAFEKDAHGREEWVDKGPEFGFGKRGQNRLQGVRGPPRGGGSGDGGGGGGHGFRSGRRGGDSWRGGSGSGR